MIIFLVLINLFPQAETENWSTLLQRKYQIGCSADFLVSQGLENGSLMEGLPFVAIGDIPLIPWTDFEMNDPIQSGLWGRGLWNVNYLERAFQDSLSLSKIGLIQNTKEHSRYLFQLDRPLPGFSSGNFQIQRDDSVSTYSSIFKKQNFSFRLQSWEGANYGWGSWGGWASEKLLFRAGFSRLSHADRRPEIMMSVNKSFSTMDFSLGGVLSKVDSLVEGRAVLGLLSSFGNSIFYGYFEHGDAGQAYWGGVKYSVGDMVLTGSFSSPVSSVAFQTVSIRHPYFNIVGQFAEDISLAADASYRYNCIRGKSAMCWNFDTDSLSTSSWLLLGVDWYRGRFEAGPRFAFGVDSEGSLEETLDILAGFSLVTFSFSSAVEHITHDLERNWSFGITWFFTDQSPVTPIDEEEQRNGN